MNLSTDTRYMYYVFCCRGWQNMPKKSQLFKSLIKSEQSEPSERKRVGRNALQFYQEIVSIQNQP